MSSEWRVVDLIRAMVNSAQREAIERARTTNVLSGTIEDLDEDLQVVYVRMDDEAMASDPTLSNNYEEPGVIPATRLGSTNIGEAVRVMFDGTAGASAIQTAAEKLIMLPFGAEEGQRIRLDGEGGFMAFFDEDGELVGYLDPTQWFVGRQGGLIARLDPIGGLRLRDEHDILRAQLSASEGLTVTDAETRVASALLSQEGLTVVDPTTGDRISVTSGNTSAVPTPHWLSSQSSTPSATHETPAIDSFGTGDDLDLRFVSAAEWMSRTGSYTPPTGYTERSDTNHPGTLTLATSSATRDPADAAPGAANFVNTVATWTRRNGHSVIVRGGGGASPAFRSITVTPVLETTSSIIEYEGTMPAGVVAGDLLVAFVTLAGPGVPFGWTVPEGWTQLGVQVAGLGTPQVLASGIWYKRAGAAEPSSDSITINLTTGGGTKIQMTVVAVQAPYAFPAGLDIRRNNRSMPRGLVAETASTTATAAIANSSMPVTVDTLNDVPLQVGRSYRIGYSVPNYVFQALAAADTVGISIEIDEGAGFTSFVRTQRRVGAAGASKGEIGISRTYVPAADMLLDVRSRLRADAVTSGFTMMLDGATDHRRSLYVDDIGAVY